MRLCNVKIGFLCSGVMFYFYNVFFSCFKYKSVMTNQVRRFLCKFDLGAFSVRLTQVRNFYTISPQISCEISPCLPSFS